MNRFERRHLARLLTARPDPATLTRRQRYARAAQRNLATGIAAMAPDSGRNTALYSAWRRCNAFRDVITEGEARVELRAAARACGLTDVEIDRVLR